MSEHPDVQILFKAVCICIGLLCLTPLVVCTESSQKNDADVNFANIIIINNLTDFNLEQDVIQGFTSEKVVISSGQTKTIHLNLISDTYYIIRDDEYVTVICMGMPYFFTVDKRIGLILDNRSIEVGSNFIQKVKPGSIHILMIYYK
jgi:hypothetical protein